MHLHILNGLLEHIYSTGGGEYILTVPTNIFTMLYRSNASLPFKIIDVL